jgi:hypothetical protein
VGCRVCGSAFVRPKKWQWDGGICHGRNHRAGPGALRKLAAEG